MQKSSSLSFRIMLGLLILIIIPLSFFVYYLYSSRPKVAYVRSLELVYSYNGMRMAHEEYKHQADVWKANSDTLRMRYESELQQYEVRRNTMNEVQRKEKELLLTRLKEDYLKYKTVVEDQAAEKEKEMTQEVFNQLNGFINDYAKKKGYDIVFGSEGSGVLLYGSKAYDITEEVLAALNKDYKLLPGSNSEK